MNASYNFADLLDLVVTDEAEGLSLHVGEQPVVHWGGEPHPVIGRALTVQDVEEFLRQIALPEEVLEFRRSGSVGFIYAFRHSVRFRVTAKRQADRLQLEFERTNP